MYSEKQNVRQLISLLKAHGINKFVVSPGSRHIPIVISLEYDGGFELYSVVDERSASFFALGLIQRFDEPVGVICTSGTASANYCSAISEAYYQHLPLLVLTADRHPAFLDQHEDQMIHQSSMYVNVAKHVANLPIVNTHQTAWHNNRLINEALLELTHGTPGPVQINIPIEDHMDAFSEAKLPDERKIERIEADCLNSEWQKISNELNDKNIIIIAGEGPVMSERLVNALNAFTRKFNAVILADKMSNCHAEHTINNSFLVLQALNGKDVGDLHPDYIINFGGNYSFNPESKGFVKCCQRNGDISNWLVCGSGKIEDPFHNLKRVFQMSPSYFFEKIVANSEVVESGNEYSELWETISTSIETPELPFSHIGIVAEFLSKLPGDSTLHLANSNSVRMAQLFPVNPTVEIHCNRGTDGIDGSMSSAVGFASAADSPVFLLIGDLSFFYDMNALWNRHIGKNLRILLCNNSGGAIMHMPRRPQFALDFMPNYISAAHETSAKAWTVDRGFKYLSAHNQEELTEGIRVLTDLSVDGPIILETFTDMHEDTRIFKKFYSHVSRKSLEEKLKSKASSIIRKKIYRILGIRE